MAGFRQMRLCRTSIPEPLSRYLLRGLARTARALFKATGDGIPDARCIRLQTMRPAEMNQQHDGAIA
jgi:hypothetical protein